MFKIPNLPQAERNRFTRYDKKFSLLKNEIGKTMGIAVFFLVPSILLAFCGGLCLTLPGANVMSAVYYNAFLPATGGLLLSIALFYKIYKPSQKKDYIRSRWLYRAIKVVNSHIKKPKSVKDEESETLFIKEGARFLEENLLPKGNFVYQQDFINRLKKYYENSEKKKHKVIVQVLDQTVKNLAKSPKIRPLQEGSSQTAAGSFESSDEEADF